MDEAWFSGVADELAAAIVDAQACAAACEELLETSHESLDPAQQQRLLAAIVAPAAISRILVDLIDRPRPLVIAAARVCQEMSLHGADELDRLGLPLDTRETIASLRRSAGSCERLLEATGGG